ncbi:MAG: GNAT family N-acetyltransferase [Calothrix sp. SM1_7_51]|nr:GNAT family N-acetyltransferase [Calothrix sp. SM1_7_51]
MKKYHGQRSFAQEPALSDTLFNLLDVVFPEVDIRAAASVARKLGAPWESASTPFFKFQDEIAVTHVGVLEIPMYLMGKLVTVGGIHAVSTHPEFRRRGYYREVMEEVLDYCDSRYETLVLTTSQAEFYKPFGFRVVEEYVFKAKCDKSLGLNQTSNGFRFLNLADRDDFQILHRLLEKREPVSNLVGVVNEKALFFVNEATSPLHYAPDLDAIVVMEIEKTTLKLFDIAATQVCTLKSIIERIPQLIEEVEIYFTPDRLDIVNYQIFPHELNETFLMVRGKFTSEVEKFMLPRSARC